MSELVTGTNIPKDLLAVLKKYGMPEVCTAFKIQCSGPKEIVTMEYTAYMREPKAGETFEDVKETRIYRLTLIEYKHV